jgi:hypothetical protein
MEVISFVAKNADQKNSYWNGKNLTGQDHVGDKNLISEGSKSKQGSKYEVSNDTKAITSQDLE